MVPQTLSTNAPGQSKTALVQVRPRGRVSSQRWSQRGQSLVYGKFLERQTIPQLADETSWQTACTAARATGSEPRETSWSFPPAAAAHTSQAGQAHGHPQSPWGSWHEDGLLLASVQHRWATFPTPQFGRAGSRLTGRTWELGPGHDPGGFRAAAALKSGGLAGAPEQPGPGRGAGGPEDRQDPGSRAGPGQARGHLNSKRSSP